MKFQVTEIEFDFSGDDLDVFDYEYQDEIYYYVTNNIWEVDDEEDLVDNISDSTGWLIKYIDYVEVSV
jgi:hypothetical protein